MLSLQTMIAVCVPLVIGMADSRFSDVGTDLTIKDS